jgi:ribonuclease HI
MEKIFMYTDGGSRGNPGPAGAGVYICNEKKDAVRTAKLFLGKVTNNEAEYQAVILGLETLKKVFGKDKIKDLPVEIRMDSELICRQLKGEYQVKDEKLVPFFMKIWNARVADFHNLSFVHIPREQNAEADKLANEAMDEGGKAQSGLF